MSPDDGKGPPWDYAALAGLRLLAQIGYESIDEGIAQLVARSYGAASAAGFVVRTPCESPHRGALVVIHSVDAQTLVGKRAQHGVIASSRGNGLRVSFHAYNDEADVDAVVAALEANAGLVERDAAASY